MADNSNESDNAESDNAEFAFLAGASEGLGVGAEDVGLRVGF